MLAAFKQRFAKPTVAPVATTTVTTAPAASTTASPVAPHRLARTTASAQNPLFDTWVNDWESLQAPGGSPSPKFFRCGEAPDASPSPKFLQRREAETVVEGWVNFELKPFQQTAPHQSVDGEKIFTPQLIGIVNAAHSQVDLLVGLLSDAAQTIKALEARLNIVQESNKIFAAQLIEKSEEKKQQSTAHEAEVEEIHRSQISALKEMNDKHQNKIGEICTTHTTQVEEMRAAHTTQVEEMRAAHKAEVDGMLTARKAYTIEVEHMLATHNAKVSVMETEIEYLKPDAQKFLTFKGLFVDVPSVLTTST